MGEGARETSRSLVRMRRRLAAEEKKFRAAPAAVKQHSLQESDTVTELQFPSKIRITAPRLKRESRNMLLQLAALLSKFHFSFVEAKFLYVEVWPI